MMRNKFRSIDSHALSVRARSVAVAVCLALSASGHVYAESAHPVGGTMVVAIGYNPAQLNTTIAVGVALSMPAMMINEGLIRMGKDNMPKPALATSWDVSSDSKTITFHLRSGVKWQDGQDFTSADVKYTFDKLTPLHPRASTVFKNVEAVDTPDPLTVVVHLKAPFGPFIDFLTADNVAIQAKHIYDNGTDPRQNPYNMHPMGTGPFMFKSWAQGQNITLVRNPNYWDKGKPYLDRLIFQVMPDANSRIAALEAGDVDYVANYDMSTSDVARLRQMKSLKVNSDRGVARPMLMFYNTKNPALQNVAVRHAMLEAINRPLLLNAAFSSLGKVGVSSIPPSFAWAYNPAIDYSKMYPYNPQAAAKELDSAGFPVKSGSRFTMRFTYDPSISGFSAAAQILRDNWKKVGINVVLEPRETNVWLNSVYKTHDYDIAMTIYNSIGDPTLGLDRSYRCEVPGSINTNPTQYCNPALDALYDQAAHTYAKSDRAKYYAKTQEIVARDLPTVDLLDLGYADAVSTKFGGLDAVFQDRGDINIQFEDAYLKK